MAKTPPLNRPGVSEDFLKQHDIRRVDRKEAYELTGEPSPGIFIPYTNDTGHPIIDGNKQYGRLRLDRPKGSKKYHQKSKTGVHPYFPIPTTKLESADYIILVEGEFKALCLAENGFPAIGLPGFWGFQQRTGEDRYLDQSIGRVIDHLDVRRVYYMGDSDTVLNYAFFQAASRLDQLIGGKHEVLMIQLPIDGDGKGIDDRSENLDVKVHVENLMRGATQITRDTEAMAWAAIEAAEVAIERQVKTDRGFGKFFFDRACKMAAQMRGVYLAGNLVKLIKRISGISVSDIREAITRLQCSTLDIDEALKSLDLYYDPAGHGRFIFLNKKDQYIPMPHSSALMFLRCEGYSSKTAKDLLSSPADMILKAAMDSRAVRTTERLAGYRKGVVKTHEGDLLVMNDPGTPNLQPGDWSHMKSFIEALLGKDEDQIAYFHSWLKLSIESFLSFDPEKWVRGQVLFLVGPANSGKSLLQRIITELLGGAEGRPFQFISGETAFNADLYYNVHLAMEDEQADTSIATRRKISAALKTFAVNPSHSLHAKGKTPITVRPLLRVTSSINGEDENLQTLPLMDPSMQDKMSILSCSQPEKLTDARGAKTFVESLLKEIFHYGYWLVNSFTIPEEIEAPRTGVAAYRNPEIMKAVTDMTPETELYEILQDYMTITGKDGIHDQTPTEIITALEDNEHVTKLLKKSTYNRDLTPRKFGRYMARAARDMDGNVSSKRGNRGTLWTVLNTGYSMTEGLE